MQNAWRVVDCTNLSGQLKYSRGHLKVCNDHDNKTNVIALSDIAVLLIGLRCSCSAGLLHQCVQYGVSIMPCDWRGVPVAAFHPWLETHTRIAARQIAQSYMTMPRKKSAWAKVVKNKIAGQASCLRILGRQGEGSLLELARSVHSGDATNVEGRAAREYWRYLFPPAEGFKRVAGAGYGRNAQLDYGYMVLRGFTVKAVISAGLNPVLGINHHSGSNYFCLADDLIEVFRPAIDVRVAQLGFQDSLEDKQTKKYIIESVNRQFNGTGLTIPSVINDFAQSYGMYAEEKIEKLPVPQFVRD